MARTTPSSVKNIYDTDLSDSAISDWIDIASEMVDGIASNDSSISSTRLTQIEKLLAAHYASSQDQRISSTGRETASVDYQGETGMGLMGTKYGQQAVQLDPTGILLDSTKRTATLSVPDTKGIYNE